MIKLNTKLAAAAVLSAVLLAGCGGGGGGGGGGGIVSLFGSCTQDQTIAAGAVVNYTQQIIAFDQNSEPVDINCRTLATDDTVDPTPII